jgi:hypothetical protein
MISTLLLVSVCSACLIVGTVAGILITLRWLVTNSSPVESEKDEDYFV